MSFWKYIELAEALIVNTTVLLSSTVVSVAERGTVTTEVDQSPYQLLVLNLLSEIEAIDCPFVLNDKLPAPLLELDFISTDASVIVLPAIPEIVNTSPFPAVI